MIKTITKEIEGASYSVTQFTARIAIRIQTKLIKALGPFIFELPNSSGRAVQMLAESISEQNVETLVCEILSCTRKGGMELTPTIIDIEFAGDLGTLYEVIRFALEVNFENFWKALGIGKDQELHPLPEPQLMKKTFTKK